MCQRFFVYLLVFSGFIVTQSHGRQAIRNNIFVPGPGGFTVIRLVNSGIKDGWVDIANQTGVSVTGERATPVTLVNYEKQNRPQYVLDQSLNHVSRKFNFRGVRNIACFAYGVQVDCNKVVTIVYYSPNPDVTAVYGKDLELTT